MKRKIAGGEERFEACIEDLDCCGDCWAYIYYKWDLFSGVGIGESVDSPLGAVGLTIMIIGVIFLVTAIMCPLPRDTWCFKCPAP